MKKNLEGQTFGELTVIKRAETKGRTKWTCRCSCGTVKDINEYDLISGKSKSCGCKRRRKPIDITGKRYGKLVAKEIVGMGDNGTSIWHCVCDCGNEIDVKYSSLANGEKKSCGCLEHAPKKDLTGRRIGTLTVNKYIGNNGQWECICDCGNVVSLSTYQLTHGRRTCGKNHKKPEKIKTTKFKDLTGMKFGKLTVVKRVENDSNNKVNWLCKCSCGGEKIASSHNLLSGVTTHCGCEKRTWTKYDLKGKKFNSLTVLEYVGHSNWKCKCDCGNTTIVSGSALVDGHIKSCGCSSYNHGISKEEMNKEADLRGNKDSLVDFMKTLTNIEENAKVFEEPKDELIGKKVNMLTVISNNGDGTYKCKCDCGNYKDIKRKPLVTGVIKSCGCLKHAPHRINMVGKKFGKITVLEFDHISDNHVVYWKCRCDCGTVKLINGNDLRLGKIYSCGCVNVSHRGSKEENNIKDYINELIGVREKLVGENESIKVTKEKVIDTPFSDKKQEIDILVRGLNFGVEYNGSPFHASLGAAYDNNKPRKYHQNKFLQAKEQGIHLISIFDVDWNTNQDKIKMYLKSLVIPNKKVFARKCELKKIDKNTANAFTDKYHLQGHARLSSISYGLYYDNELLSVMSFGVVRLHKKEAGRYELHRYCVKDGYTVVGGANKLLTAFEREYEPKYLLSYSDNDYFSGGIYDKLGFSNDGQTNPRYYWYNNGVEIKREKCQLKYLKLDYPELYKESEGEKNREDYIMVKLGACKVYRSGNTRWIKEY